MLHAVIMAGGSGTRFWPESRALKPKQLLSLSGDKSMLQATVSRIAGLVPAERVYIATNERLVDAVRLQLPNLPTDSLLGEPCKRDTAPCIGWAAFHCLQSDPEAVMAVMPSDHVIQDSQAFCEALSTAERLVEKSPNRIVTFGITPTYPAESFGYIEKGEALDGAGRTLAFQAVRFREKPKAEQAKEFIASGRFLWNSGIFVWKASTILEYLREQQPQMFQHLQTISAAYGSPDFSQTLAREFAAIRPISIDYAVLEHAKDVAVIQAPFDWDDVGSWNAISRLNSMDEQGNTVEGKHLAIRTSGSIIRGPKDHLIVTLGLKDVLVVHTGDATLVANKHDEESIRQVVKLLEERSWNEYL